MKNKNQPLLCYKYFKKKFKFKDLKKGDLFTLHQKKGLPKRKNCADYLFIATGKPRKDIEGVLEWQFEISGKELYFKQGKKYFPLLAKKEKLK